MVIFVCSGSATKRLAEQHNMYVSMFLLILLISCLYVYCIFYIASIVHIFCFMRFIFCRLCFCLCLTVNCMMWDTLLTICGLEKRDKTQKTIVLCVLIISIQNEKFWSFYTQRKKQHKQTQPTKHHVLNKTEKRTTSCHQYINEYQYWYLFSHYNSND